MIWLKLVSAVVQIVLFIDRQIERYQIRSAAKAEAERDALRQTMEGLRDDKKVKARVDSDPSLYKWLRDKYRRQ